MEEVNYSYDIGILTLSDANQFVEDGKNVEFQIKLELISWSKKLQPQPATHGCVAFPEQASNLLNWLICR